VELASIVLALSHCRARLPSFLPTTRGMVLEDREYGAVFTRRWMVELMLDSCGYNASMDLGSMVAVEPSCGDGAFLLPMVERLSASLRQHGKDLSEAVGAIRAFDLQLSHVESARCATVDQLVADHWPQDLVEAVVAEWITHGDFLLANHEPNATFVIGNPPYIRSEDMTIPLRSQYMSRYKTMTAGSDIFVGFIEAGLELLAQDGVMCFICADRWMHNNYGKRLRRLVVEGDYAVELVYEMHGVDAFAEQVSAYPAIVQVRRGHQGSVRYATARPAFGELAASRLSAWGRGPASPLHDPEFTATVLADWFDTDSVWPSGSPERLSLLRKLEEEFHPLQDATTGTKIGIGIATGSDRVFVVHDDSVAEPDRLLPLVVTDHVRTGDLAWSGTWLVNPWQSDGSLIDLGDYPRLSQYLEPFRASLTLRHVAQKSHSSSWFRTIDKVHPMLASTPKLLLQDMKASIQPVLDEGNYYPHHNLYWITSEKWDLRVLGGLLLSRVAEMFVHAYGVKMRGGTMRFQAQYLRLIHVPDPDSISPEIEARLVRAFNLRDAEEATLAALVAYGLDELPD